MKAIHSKRFVIDATVRSGLPVAVVVNDKIVGCYVPCEEFVPLKGMPVIDSKGATRLYLPLQDEKKLAVIKSLRMIGD